ncbi:MAG: hypothetical protein WBN81_05745 [Gammaproteobacteria bacterium]
MRKYLTLFVALLLALANQNARSEDCPCWKNFKTLSRTCKGGEVSYCGVIDKGSVANPFPTFGVGLECGRNSSGRTPLIWQYSTSLNTSSGVCVISTDNKNTGKHNELYSKEFFTFEEFEACAKIIVAAGDDMGVDCEAL